MFYKWHKNNFIQKNLIFFNSNIIFLIILFNLSSVKINL